MDSMKPEETRFMEVIRKFPGMYSADAARRAGLQMTSNRRAAMVFWLRRAGYIAPAVQGQDWGRLYPAEPAAS